MMRWFRVLLVILSFLVLVAMPAGCLKPAPPTSYFLLQIKMAPTEGGKVEVSPEAKKDGRYEPGTIITLCAIANSGFSFGRWVEGPAAQVIGMENPLTITISSDLSIAAVFEKTPTTPTPLPTPTPPPTSTPIITLPARCGEAGAQAYTEPLPPIPSPVAPLDRGTVIMVTSSSDSIDGDIASVQRLIGDPGPDGVSLREALQATNNSPGIHTIRFAPQLKGMTINVGSWNGKELPPLIGGSVTINGDVDDDGTPDITIMNQLQQSAEGAYNSGFVISSTGNTLYALAIQNFPIGVLFGALSEQKGALVADMLFADNLVSNVHLKDIHRTGIFLESCHGTANIPGETRNQWSNTRFIGNIIESKGTGIDVSVVVIGDTAERLTIAHNTIRIARATEGASFGINLGAGGWLNSRANAISDAVIAYNTIEGDPEAGIRIYAGDVCASANIVNGVSIFGNRVRMAPGKLGFGCCKRDAVVVVAGDGATDHVDPNLRPIIYPEGNIVTDVSIVGNVLEGGGGSGVKLAASCCGAAKNTISNITIQGNIIDATVPPTAPFHSGIFIVGGQAAGYFSRPSAENEISHVLIDANTIRIETQGIRQSSADPEGGIVVMGGHQAAGNRVTDIRIFNNHVDSDVPAINLIGGWGDIGSGETIIPATGNSVTEVELSCNWITRNPVGIIFNNFLVKGVNLAGGFGMAGKASGNSVRDVQLQDNVVAGALNDVLVLADVGPEASQNMVDVATTPSP